MQAKVAKSSPGHMRYRFASKIANSVSRILKCPASNWQKVCSEHRATVNHVMECTGLTEVQRSQILGTLYAETVFANWSEMTDPEQIVTDLNDRSMELDTQGLTIPRSPRHRADSEAEMQECINVRTLLQKPKRHEMEIWTNC